MTLKYKPRKIQSIGAQLVLVWNFIVLVSFLHIPSIHGNLSVLYLLLILFLPIMGYVSDKYIGKYKVLSYGLRIIFVLAVSINITMLINRYYASNTTPVTIANYTLNVLFLIGTTGIVVNMLSFGIDQLIGLSSSNITSYISWFCWTTAFSYIFISFIHSCYCGEYNSQTTYIALPLFLAIAVITDFIKGKFLIAEPPSNHSPFSLIYKVLKFAVKNKYPIKRSAFTYWEDQPYTRIDLAKTKYGGPFTTEQVEDVKTFFRLLPTIFLICVLGGEVSLLSQMGYKIDSKFSNCFGLPLTGYLAVCYKEAIIKVSNSVIVFLFIPLLEFLLYPICSSYKCFIRIGILHKILIGAFLTFLAKISLLTMETVNILNSPNSNTTCHFNEDSWPLVHNRDNSDLKWLLLIQVLSAVTVYLMFTSVLEFVCAQSPYSMRGLLIGLTYSAVGIAIFISYGAIALFKLLTKSAGKKCGIWYYTASTFFSCCVICFLCILLKRYTFRKRNDVLGNDQIFAVNYFTKYTTSRKY